MPGRYLRAVVLCVVVTLGGCGDTSPIDYDTARSAERADDLQDRMQRIQTDR